MTNRAAVRDFILELGTGVALFAVTLAPSLQAEEPAFHLTGVLGASSGKLFAVIENADGEQRLLSQGEEFDGGRVARISSDDKTVLLVFPERQLLLTLTGSARPVVPDEPVDAATDYEQVEDRRLSRDELYALLELSREADSISESESSARLNKLLGLGDSARVIAFDSRGAASSRQLLLLMAERLEDMHDGGGEFLGSVIVDEGAGNQRFYIHSE